MLKIQEFIRNFKSIKDANYFLSQEFDINSSKGKLGDDVVYTYNYGPNADKKNTLSNEARGLILDSEGLVVCQSIPRFFHHSDSMSPNLHWDTTRAERMVDGTQVTVYNHKGKYYVATKHHPTADIPMGSIAVSYKAAVEFFLCGKLPPYDGMATKEWWYWFDPHPRDYCFVFEIASPDNRKVTPYDKYDMYLLTIIDKTINKECSHTIVDKFAESYGFLRPKGYFISCPTDLGNLVGYLDVLDEGFVLIDGNKTRHKAKNPSWTALSETLDVGATKLSPNVIAKIVLDGDSEDIIGFFPKYERIFSLFRRTLEESETEAEYLWSEYSSLRTTKDFATEVSHHWLSGLLFAAFLNKVSHPLQAASTLKPESLVKEVNKRYPGQFEVEFNTLAKKVGGYR